jgi:hypothetical protein
LAYEQAFDDLYENNEQAGINSLPANINTIEAQREKKIINASQ